MNSPTPHPEFQKLIAEREFLRERLAALAEEEGLLKHEGAELIARYYQ